MKKKVKFGDRNKELSKQLFKGKTYYDWVVTTSFYSCIHYVESKILPVDLNGIECKCLADVRSAYKMAGRHSARERLVFDELGGEVGARYKWLQDRSRYSRYETFKINNNEAEKALQYLDFIENKCVK